MSGDDFLDRLSKLNGDDIAGPEPDNAAQEEEDATDAFLKRLAEMDLSGAPPGCAPMNPNYNPEDAGSPTSAEPTPTPTPPAPKPKPKPTPQKKKAAPAAPKEQPPPPGDDNVNIEASLSSSVWKDRKAAYEQMARCFQRKANFAEYAAHFEKCLEEKNKMAYKELGKAFLAFAKNAPDDLVKAHLPQILESSINALGDPVKGTIMQVWYAALETLDHELWHSKALEGMKSKSRKVPGVVVEIVATALGEFGGDVVDSSTVLEWAMDLCKNSSDAAVKKHAQDIIVKCYGAIGSDVADAVEDAGIKKAIVKKLKKEFEKAKPITPTRFKRGAEPSADAGGDDGGAASPKKKVEKKAKPKPQKKKLKLKGKDIFVDLDKEFEENMNGSNWKPKKAGLDMLCEAADSAKAITASARFDVVKSKLPELCGDTNMNVLTVALKAAGLLADKMEPKAFLGVAKAIIPNAVSAWKQKKSSIKLYNDQLFMTLLTKVGVKFSDMKDPILEGLKDRQAVFKTNLTEFLELIAKNEETQPLIVDDIAETDVCDALVAVLKDKDAKVRKAAGNALGHIAGFTQNGTFMDTIDELKDKNKAVHKNIAKILKEYEGKAPVGAVEEEEPEPVSPPPKKKSKPKKKAVEQDEEEVEAAPAPKKKKAKAKAKKGGKSRKGASRGRAKPSKHAEEDAAAGDKDPISAKDKSLDKYGEGDSMSSDEAGEKIAELLEGSSSELDHVDSAKWAEKQAALEVILQKVKEGGTDSLAVIRFFMYKGIKQSNANASKMFVQILISAVRMDPDISEANALIPLDENGMFPVFGDKKCVALCKEYCETVCEAIGPKIFIPFLMAKLPTDSRGAKVRGPVMEVIADTVRDYGMSSTNYKFMLMKCHELLNNSPRGEEKDAIIETFKHCYQQTGTFFRNTLFTSVNNPRMQKTLQEALDPIEEDGSQGKFEPTKKPRNGDFAKPLDMESLVPRKDLSKDMNEAAGKLSDGSWKIRKEGCDQIEEILKANGNRMKPVVPSSMWGGLRSMQKDTNNNLKVTANKVVGLLVVAGGEKMSKHTKDIIPQVFETCGEGSKPVARAAAEAVKTWAMNTNYKTLTNHGHNGLINPKARPHIVPVYKEVFEHYDSQGVEMGEGMEGEFLEDILKCCMDKDAKIKSAVKSFFPLITKHVGGRTVLKTIKNEFKAGDQATLQKSLKKFLADIEEDAPKKKKGKEVKKSKKADKKSKSKKKKKEEEAEPEPEPEPEEEMPIKVNAKLRKIRLGKKRRYKGSWVPISTSELKTMRKWGDSCCDKDMFKLMLGERSDWKQWQEVMTILEGLLQESPAPFLNNCDIIMQWTCWRCCEKNATNSDMAFMNFWKKIVSYYARNEMTWEHHEADPILPMIIERCLGSMKKQVSALAQELFEAAEDVYSPLWMCRYLWDCIETSKNGRARNAALTEMCRLFNDYGIEIIAKKPGKKQLLVSLYKMMDKGDNAFRKEALPVFQTFSHILGKEKVLKVVGKAPPKIKDQIAARLSKITFDSDFHPAKSTKYEKSGGKEPPPEEKKKKSKKAASSDKQADSAKSSGPEPAAEVAPTGNFHQPVAQPRMVQYSEADLNSLPAAFQPINWSNFKYDNLGTSSAFDFKSTGDPAASGVSTTIKNTNSAFSIPGMPNFDLFSSTFAVPGMTFPEPAPLAPPETIPDIIAGLEGKRADCLEALCNGFKGNKWSDEALKPHTKRLVKSLISWWQDILNDSDTIGPTEKQTLSENLIECLFDISQKPSMLATLSMESLESFIRIMLISLISPNVRRSFSNRKSLIARLNDITLGVLQNCDRTMAFYILISFLKQAEPEETDHPIESSANFSNVVVKCLAKLMILIPKVIRTMKVDQILQVIHQFFTLKPPKVWNRPGCNNKPYRVARTCLSKFVEFKGPEILQDLRKVVGVNPNPKPVIQLFTEEFIEKKFPNYDLDNPATSKRGSGSNILRSSSSSLPDYSIPRRVSETGGVLSDAQIHEELVKIVDSLDPAERGYSDLGLTRLNDFLAAHPRADLETVLVGKTDVFQGFVRRGLKQNEESNRPNFSLGSNSRKNSVTRRTRMNRTPSATSVSSVNSLTGTNTSKMSTEDLRERLNKLRNSSVARTSRKRDNSISIDNIRDRLAKFQTTTVGRQDSMASTARHDSVLSGLNRETSIGTSFQRESSNSNMSGISGLGALPSTQSSNSVLSEVTERRQSTTLSDLRARLNKIKQNS